MADRKLTVRIIGDDESLRRTFTRSTRAASDFDKNISRSARGAVAATVSFKGLGRSLAFGSNAFLGGAGVVFAVKAFSQAASNMAEQTSKANVVFGASSKVVQDFARNALGLANDEALQTASTFGALLKPLGLTGKQAADTSVQLTKLGVDFASFFNTDPSDALQAISSGLVGEVEPLRRYGVLLSQARVQQEALSETGKRHVKQLTNQELVQARLAIIFKDSSQAQGDFARTQGGLANQQRLLAANVRNLEISLGRALNPTILEVTRNLNGWLSSSENQKKVTDDLKTAVNGVIGVVKVARDVIHDVDAVTGSFANTVKLLIGIKVASVIGGWTKALVGFEIAAGAGGGAKGVTTLGAKLRQLAQIGILSIGFRFPKLGEQLAKLTTLRGSLRALGAIGTIVIPIEIVIHRRQVDDFLEGLGDKFTQAQQGGFTDALAKTEAKIANIIPGVHVDWRSLTKAIKDGTPDIEKASDAVKTLTRASTQMGDQVALAGAKAAHGLALTATAAGNLDRAAGGVRVEQKNTFFDNALARILKRGGLQDLQGQLSAITKAEGLLKQRLAKTKDVTRRLNLEDQIIELAGQAKDIRGQIAARGNQFFDSKISRILSRGGQGTLGQQLRAISQASALIEKRIAATKDVTRKINLEDQLLDLAAQRKSVRQQIAADFIDALQLKLNRAEATATFDDDLKVLAQIKAGILREIKEFGATTDLQSQLFDATQRIKEKKQAQISAKQFRQLGLTATGDEITPGVKNLQRRLRQLTGNIAGTSLDTPKLRSQLARFRKVLSEGLVPKDVRAKIREMMDAISDELKNRSGPLTKTSGLDSKKILEGLGLSPDQVRELQSRLSGTNSAGQRIAGKPTAGSRNGDFVGGRPIVVESHTTIQLDGATLTKVVTRGQQKTRRRNPPQRRGPNRGRGD